MFIWKFGSASVSSSVLVQWWQKTVNKQKAIKQNYGRYRLILLALLRFNFRSGQKCTRNTLQIETTGLHFWSPKSTSIYFIRIIQTTWLTKCMKLNKLIEGETLQTSLKTECRWRTLALISFSSSKVKYSISNGWNTWNKIKHSWINTIYFLLLLIKQSLFYY